VIQSLSLFICFNLDVSLKPLIPDLRELLSLVPSVVLSFCGLSRVSRLHLDGKRVRNPVGWCKMISLSNVVAPAAGPAQRRVRSGTSCPGPAGEQASQIFALAIGVCENPITIGFHLKND
jgi:hypothetical protein